MSTLQLPILKETRPGNYFVSNYPPYSYWKPEQAAEALATLHQPPKPDTPLGLYLHIPFCRRRCHFCYFKVYTDKNAGEVKGYLDSTIDELRLHAAKAYIGGRKPRFIYFGGGTPSYIASKHLAYLVDNMQRLLPWDEAEEVAFECEPGTLTEGKLKAIKHAGVTRLSLGIENFNDAILKANGRAHLEKEIGRAYNFARKIGFRQINIDLIAGMLGETEENWRDCVRKTIALDPDAITVYQMEVPYNTTIFKRMRSAGDEVAPVAEWDQKREWVRYAFEQFEAAGYHIGSAYTAVKKGRHGSFLYRDMLWRGADMLGLGVASFSHVQGMHFQNDPDFEPYRARVAKGEIPISRAFRLNDEERFLRQFILQMKLGAVPSEFFISNFGIDPLERFAAEFAAMQRDGFAVPDPNGPRLTREGLLQVDRLLHQFFLPRHRN